MPWNSLAHLTTKKEIDEIIRTNEEAANPLKADEISAIYGCYNSPKTCRVGNNHLNTDRDGLIRIITRHEKTVASKRPEMRCTSF